MASEVDVVAGEASTATVESHERRVQDNLAVMHRYFDLLFSKDIDSMLELIDDHIEWLVVPTGTVIRRTARSTGSASTSTWRP